MDMDYVGDPLDTVGEIQRVLGKDFGSMEKNVNILLRKLDSELGISDAQTAENKALLKKFVLSNEARLQEIFRT